MSKLEEYNKAKNLYLETKTMFIPESNNWREDRKIHNISVKARATNVKWIEAIIKFEMFGCPVTTQGLTNQEMIDQDQSISAIFKFLGKAIRKHSDLLIKTAIELAEENMKLAKQAAKSEAYEVIGKLKEEDKENS